MREDLFACEEERRSRRQTRIIDICGVTAIVALAILLYVAFKGG